MAGEGGWDEAGAAGFGERRLKNTLPLYGNKESMNLNSMILTNILGSPYFKEELIAYKTFHEVIDEIYYKVEHLEPWEKNSRKLAGQVGMCAGVRGVAAGGIVSTAYCLLFKLFTLKLTRKQVTAMMNHKDSPYIRGIGFMYVRYSQPPADFWDWFSPYLEDEEDIDLKAGGGYSVTVGEICRMMLSKLDWFGTLFPRLPVNIQKNIEARLQEFQSARIVAARNTRESNGQEDRRDNNDDDDGDGDDDGGGEGWGEAARRASMRNSPVRNRSRERYQEKKRSRSRSRERLHSRSHSRDRARFGDRRISHSRDRSRRQSPSRVRSRIQSPSRDSRRQSPSRERSRRRTPSRERSRRRTPSRERSKRRTPSRERSRRQTPSRERTRSRDRCPQSRSRDQPRSRVGRRSRSCSKDWQRRDRVQQRDHSRGHARPRSRERKRSHSPPDRRGRYK